MAWALAPSDHNVRDSIDTAMTVSIFVTNLLHLVIGVDGGFEMALIVETHDEQRTPSAGLPKRWTLNHTDKPKVQRPGDIASHAGWDI